MVTRTADTFCTIDFGAITPAFNSPRRDPLLYSYAGAKSRRERIYVCKGHRAISQPLQGGGCRALDAKHETETARSGRVNGPEEMAASALVSLAAIYRWPGSQ